jgi:uncharacterized protein involved in type VI secretion and phage assembly
MPASDFKSPAAVTIAGRPIELEHVERVEVRNFTGLPDMATIRIADPEGKQVGAPQYKIGDPVEVKLGQADERAGHAIFKGEIVAAEVEFTTSAARLSFRAYDLAHRLQRNRRSLTFQDQTTSDIVKKVLQTAGIQPGTIDSTTTVHAFMQQSMETDLDFLKRLAAMDNCEVGVEDGKGYLSQRRNGTGTTPVFKWRENAISFRPRTTAAQQHESVTVQSYDPQTKETLSATVTEPTAVAPVAADARKAGKGFGRSDLLIADRVVASAAEAKQLAQSTLDSLAGGSFEAEGEMKGDPAVKAGGKLKIEGFKAPYDGEYLLTSVMHIYGSGQYRTKFSISGRHPRTLTDVMSPKPDREWGANGLVIGLVTNIDDPEGQGRVRVKYPALGDRMESTWSRIATPGAGKDRGMMFLPEVGDEVVVAFEHGDTRRPVVLGALYNGKDKPSAKMLEGAPRGASWVVHTTKDAEFQTEKQFMITAKEHMEMTIARGDGTGDLGVKADDKIEIKAGTTILLEGTGEVTIKSSAGINVDATGPLKLKGATVDINGTAGVTVKGAIINIG